MSTTKWKQLKLNDVLSKIVGGGTPSKAKPEYWDGDIQWASVKDMADGVYKLSSTVDTITDIGLKNSSSNLIKKGNVIISTRMGLGRCFIANIDVAINQDLKALIPKSNFIDTNFLLWLMVSLSEVIESMGTGTTVKGITIDVLKNLDISLPPFPTQIKIASILSAYDDLIENNTRRIKILEEMAQMLYREWFVNFRFPNHENVKMVESEIGLLPEGWEVVELSDVINFKNGKTIKADYTGKYDVYGSNGIIGKTDEARYKNSIVIGRVGAYCGSLIYCKSIFNASDNTIIAEPIDSSRFCVELSYYTLENLNLRNYAGGSAQPLLTQNTIKKIPVILPELSINRSFERIIEPILDFKFNLVDKNINLRKTRDLLLPKLISGEIDVENLDIETVAAAA